MRSSGEFRQNVSGYHQSGPGPDGSPLRTARSRVYGELTSTGTKQLIGAVKLAAGDVFLDLGSGLGQVVLQAAIAVPGLRAIGIEIDGRRHEIAATALARAEAAGAVQPGRCTFRHADMLTASWEGANVLFAHSTCYSNCMMTALLRRLRAVGRPITFAATERLAARAERHMTFIASHRCRSSWNPYQQIHLYGDRCLHPDPTHGPLVDDLNEWRSCSNDVA